MTTGGDRVFPFGKYSYEKFGTKITIAMIAVVDPGYLRWALDNMTTLSPTFREDIQRALNGEFGGRGAEDPASEAKRNYQRQQDYWQRQRERAEKAQRQQRSTQPPPKQEEPVSDGVITKWFRQMAMKYHPDRQNGSDIAMKAINDAHETLRKMVGV